MQVEIHKPPPKFIYKSGISALNRPCRVFATPQRLLPNSMRQFQVEFRHARPAPWHPRLRQPQHLQRRLSNQAIPSSECISLVYICHNLNLIPRHGFFAVGEMSVKEPLQKHLGESLRAQRSNLAFRTIRHLQIASSLHSSQ